MTDNVDLFADVAASLFVRLQRSFPIPIDVEIGRSLSQGPATDHRRALVRQALTAAG